MASQGAIRIVCEGVTRQSETSNIQHRTLNIEGRVAAKRRKGLRKRRGDRSRGRAGMNRDATEMTLAESSGAMGGR